MPWGLRVRIQEGGTPPPHTHRSQKMKQAPPHTSVCSRCLQISKALVCGTPPVSLQVGWGPTKSLTRSCSSERSFLLITLPPCSVGRVPTLRRNCSAGVVTLALGVLCFRSPVNGSRVSEMFFILQLPSQGVFLQQTYPDTLVLFASLLLRLA